MDLLEFLTKYWYIILSVIAIVIGWTEIKGQNADQERRIKNLEDESKALNPVLIEIRTKLASIEATLKMLCGNKNQ